MLIKDCYPLYHEALMKQEFNTQYSKIKQAYKDGKLYSYINFIIRNPKINTFANEITEDKVLAVFRRIVYVFDWLREKQVYKFDNDLWNLIQSVDSLIIDKSVFEHFPFKTIWIDHEFKGAEDITYKGAFVTIENNCFYSLFVNDDTHMVTEFGLNEYNKKTIEDIINDSEIHHPEYQNSFRELMNAVVYICSEKPDVESVKVEVEENNNKKKANIKKKTKVQINTTGKSVGRVIREYNTNLAHENKEHSSGKKGTAKAPHVRKAHYHSFWKKENGEKILIVKFLAPMIIHGNDEIKYTVRQQSERK